MSSRFLPALACAFAVCTHAPDAGAIRNGRAFDIGIANTFGVAGIDHFAELSGLLWQLDFEIYLPHQITLIPYMQLSQKFNETHKEAESGEDVTTKRQFGGFGVLVRYSMLTGVAEPFVQGGLSVPVLGELDMGAGPSIGAGVVINAAPQLGVVVQVFYMLIFGGVEEQLGDGIPGATAGLSFRW